MLTDLAPAASAVASLLADEGFRQQLSAGERAGALPEDSLRRCGEAGLFALGVPRSAGGLGLPVADRLWIHSTVGAISPSLQSMLTVHEMAVLAISRFAEAEVRNRWLPRMCTSDCLGAFALTESAGSEVQELTTRLESAQGGMRVRGTKRWISSGMRARVFLVFAASDRGPAAALVPADAAGFSRTPAAPLSAFRASCLADLKLDCLLPSSAVMKGRGLGIPLVATTCLTLGRLLVAAGALGIARAALERALRVTLRVRAPLPELSAYQSVQVTVARGHLATESAALMLQRAAGAFDARDAEAMSLAMMAKLASTGAALRCTQDSLRLHGAAGLTTEASLADLVLAAHTYNVIEGSPEVLLAVLGAHLARSGGSYDASA